MDAKTTSATQEAGFLLDPDTEEAIGDLEQQFAFFFQRIRVRWKEAAQELHPDLTPTAYKILATLAWRDEPTTATHLSEILHLDKSTLSRHIVALEEHGFVERHVDEHDGRVRSLVASPAALAAVEEQRLSRSNALRRELGTWPREDIVSLVALLRRLTDFD